MGTKSQITKIRWSCIKLAQWLSLMALSLVSQTDWNTCRQPSWGLRSGRRNWPCPPLRRTAAGRTTPPRTGFETWVNVEFLLFTTCDSRIQNKPNSFIHPYLRNKFHVLDLVLVLKYGTSFTLSFIPSSLSNQTDSTEIQQLQVQFEPVRKPRDSPWKWAAAETGATFTTSGN